MPKAQPAPLLSDFPEAPELSDLAYTLYAFKSQNKKIKFWK